MIGIGTEGAVSVWSLPDGEPLSAFDLPPGPYREPLFRRDGQWLAISVGSDNHPPELWLFAAPRDGAAPSGPPR